MAGILQLRRGLKSTYISEGSNLAEAFFVTTAESGSVSANTLVVGTSGSNGSDVVTLAKLSLANKDNTYADYNSGSFWITGDYTGSNALILDNLIVSGSTFVEGDLHLEGHLFLGSGSDDDVVRVQSEFSGSIIPDNDKLGTETPTATTAYYDFGSDSKRFRNIYLQKDATGAGFLSGSHIDLTGNIRVDGEGRFGTLRVDDLTDNRILLAGAGGEVEDDSNLTYDGQDFRLTNSDFYQSGSGASFQFSGAGADFTGSISNFELQVDNGIVFTNAQGTLDNQSQFTWDGGTLYVDGNISGSGTLMIDGQSTLASLNVEDLTNDRILIAGTDGEVEDDQYFRYTGNDFIIGSDEHFKVTTSNGNTSISGSVQLHSTLNVDGQSTLASVNVEDLTDNRVVIVGAGGELEDSGNLTFDGSLLTVTGDTTITGDLTVQGDLTQLNVSTLNVEDKNLLIASGALNATAADGGGITIDGADATILYSSANDSFQLNKQLQVEGNISGSSFNGTTLLSSSNENFADYSQSVDSRLDAIEGPMSTSLDSRLIEIFATGSDHETRLDLQEAYSSSFTSNDLDMNGNKVLFGNVYSTEGDLPNASTYHGMFAHVHATGKGYFAHGGNWIPLLNESTYTTDSASFDSRLDAQESFSTSLDDTFATEAELNLATASLSASLAVDIASNLSEITNLNSFSSSIESHLPSGLVSGSDQLTSSYDSRYALSGSGGGGGTYSDTDVATYLNGNLDTNIIPDTNASYDIGSAEYKIRHLYLSDNSIKFGENENSLGTNVSNQLTLNGEVVGAPAGTVSGSSQVSYVELSNVPAGIVSGSDQLVGNFEQKGTGIVSGSSQLEGYVSSSTANVIEVMTSASYAAITPVSGTLYIIQG